MSKAVFENFIEQLVELRESGLSQDDLFNGLSRLIHFTLMNDDFATLSAHLKEELTKLDMSKPILLERDFENLIDSEINRRIEAKNQSDKKTDKNTDNQRKSIHGGMFETINTEIAFQFQQAFNHKTITLDMGKMDNDWVYDHDLGGFENFDLDGFQLNFSDALKVINVEFLIETALTILKLSQKKYKSHKRWIIEAIFEAVIDLKLKQNTNVHISLLTMKTSIRDTRYAITGLDETIEQMKKLRNSCNDYKYRDTEEYKMSLITRLICETESDVIFITKEPKPSAIIKNQKEKRFSKQMKPFLKRKGIALFCAESTIFNPITEQVEIDPIKSLSNSGRDWVLNIERLAQSKLMYYDLRKTIKDHIQH